MSAPAALPPHPLMLLTRENDWTAVQTYTPTRSVAVASIGHLLAAHTVTLTGANPTTYATQHFVDVAAMTLTGTNLNQTVTNAASLNISGLPTAGANVTISNIFALRVALAAPADASSALVLLGNGAAFAGSASGTYLAMDAPAGYVGDYLNVQRNGVSVIRLTPAARLYLTRDAGGSGDSAIYFAGGANYLGSGGGVGDLEVSGFTRLLSASLTTYQHQSGTLTIEATNSGENNVLIDAVSSGDFRESITLRVRSTGTLATQAATTSSIVFSRAFGFAAGFADTVSGPLVTVSETSNFNSSATAIYTATAFLLNWNPSNIASMDYRPVLMDIQAASASRFTVNGVRVTSGTYQTLNMPVHTITAGGANPTTYASIHGIRLGIVTITGTNINQTVTDVATLYVAGVPIAGTNVVFSNPALALWIDAGPSRFDGTVAYTRAAITLGAAVTTFAVTASYMQITGDAGANTIATITGGTSGMILVLEFVDALVTITDDATGAANTVNLSAAFTSTANDIVTLVSNGTSWRELARSIN